MAGRGGAAKGPIPSFSLLFTGVRGRVSSPKPAYGILDANVPKPSRTTLPRGEKHTSRHNILCARINMPLGAYRTPSSATRFSAPSNQRVLTRFLPLGTPAAEAARGGVASPSGRLREFPHAELLPAPAVGAEAVRRSCPNSRFCVLTLFLAFPDIYSGCCTNRRIKEARQQLIFTLVVGPTSIN
jgi:hypothetical protein